MLQILSGTSLQVCLCYLYNFTLVSSLFLDCSFPIFPQLRPTDTGFLARIQLEEIKYEKKNRNIALLY